MINEVAIVLLLGLFGWKIALLYILSGLLIAIFAGIIIGKLKVENLVADFIYQHKVDANINLQKQSWNQRIRYAQKYTLNIIKKVWLLYSNRYWRRSLDSRLHSN